LRVPFFVLPSVDWMMPVKETFYIVLSLTSLTATPRFALNWAGVVIPSFCGPICTQQQGRNINIAIPTSILICLNSDTRPQHKILWIPIDGAQKRNGVSPKPLRSFLISRHISTFELKFDHQSQCNLFSIPSFIPISMQISRWRHALKPKIVQGLGTPPIPSKRRVDCWCAQQKLWNSQFPHSNFKISYFSTKTQDNFLPPLFIFKLFLIYFRNLKGLICPFSLLLRWRSGVQ
jgi:hypothetical protein